MGSPRIRRAVMKIALASLALVLSTFLLNIVLTRTGALGGISLTEALADEFRIRVLSPSENQGDCRENSTTLIPGCLIEFYGYHVRLPRSTIRINSIGLRDKEYPLEKQNGTYRIFILGDSYTFGRGVDNDDTYPEILERQLNALYADTSFEVFNLGIIGAGLEEEQIRLDRYWRYSPDLLVLQTASNDLYECSSVKSALLPLLNESGLSEEYLWQAGGKYVAGLPLERECECVMLPLRCILEIAYDDSIPTLIFDTDPPLGNTSCFERKEGHNYTYLPAEPLSRKYHLSRVDPHLNAKGHAAVAVLILPVLVDIINETNPGMLT